MWYVFIWMNNLLDYLCDLLFDYFENWLYNVIILLLYVYVFLEERVFKFCNFLILIIKNIIFNVKEFGMILYLY